MQETVSPNPDNEEDQYSRTRLLIGDGAMDKLRRSHVAVFGIGGVGGYVCEALARSGVGSFDLIDSDKVSISNLNRQIIALRSTIGRYKADVMKERMLDIDPSVCVRVHRCFFLPENSDTFPFDEYDYVVDAVDTVTAKIELILKAKAAGVPVISSMGAGNKLDPGGFKAADIYDTRVCPLARVMRRELKSRGIESLKVVYSEESPVTPEYGGAEGRKLPPGSNACVPAAAGLVIASEVIKDITGAKKP